MEPWNYACMKIRIHEWQLMYMFVCMLRLWMIISTYNINEVIMEAIFLNHPCDHFNSYIYHNTLWAFPTSFYYLPDLPTSFDYPPNCTKFFPLSSRIYQLLLTILPIVPTSFDYPPNCTNFFQLAILPDLSTSFDYPHHCTNIFPLSLNCTNFFRLSSRMYLLLLSSSLLLHIYIYYLRDVVTSIDHHPKFWMFRLISAILQAVHMQSSFYHPILPAVLTSFVQIACQK